MMTAMNSMLAQKVIIPICSSCNKIRDFRGRWRLYDISRIKDSEFNLSHGLCPECAREEYQDYFPEDYTQ